jgi:hypothetical protein
MQQGHRPPGGGRPGGRVEEPEGAGRSRRGSGVLGQELEEKRQRAAVASVGKNRTAQS